MSNHHVTVLIFSLLAVITAASTLGGPSGNQEGAYHPITNLSDPYLIEIANFAFNEHNKQAGNVHLTAVQIVQGEEQEVSGTNFDLTVIANDKKQYEVLVYDQPWTKTRSLMSFKALP